MDLIFSSVIFVGKVWLINVDIGESSCLIYEIFKIWLLEIIERKL